MQQPPNESKQLNGSFNLSPQRSETRGYFLPNNLSQIDNFEYSPGDKMLKIEIQVQLSLIKMLWTEMINFHQNYQQETGLLLDGLRKNLEKQIKNKLVNSNLGGSMLIESNSQSNFANLPELVEKKDQMISQLLAELEKINEYVSAMQQSIQEKDKSIESLYRENEQFKSLLSGKELEILSYIDKNNELDGNINYQNQLIEDLKGQIPELTAKKNQEIEHLQNKIKELTEKDLETHIEDLKNQIQELKMSKKQEVEDLSNKIHDLTQENHDLITKLNAQILELTEKNNELSNSLRKKAEELEEIQREQQKNSTKVLSPFFQNAENVLSPPAIKDQTPEVENRSEKEKKAGKTVKFNFEPDPLNSRGNELPSFGKEERRAPEKSLSENEKKKFQDDIKRLKEKIYELNVERENLIWSENQAVKQLHEFQMEKGRLELMKKESNEVKKIGEAKLKKSQTMHLPDIKKKEESDPLMNEKRKEEEEKLIETLEDILRDLINL